MSLSMIEANAKSTLHEIIMAEKMDFEAKLERMARRKQWLKAHQQLIRTLLSYSVLHGSCGGGLASVRMELILLLQVNFLVEILRRLFILFTCFKIAMPYQSIAINCFIETVIFPTMKHRHVS